MSAILKALIGTSKGTSFSGSVTSQSHKQPSVHDSTSISQSPATPEPEVSTLSYLYQPKLFAVCLYYMVGILYYHYNEGWNVIDCVYFITVSVTTVGYGDYSPDNDAARLFTIFYILIGLAFIFAIINEFASSFIKQLEAQALERLDDDPNDDKAPHGWKLALSLFSILLVVFLGSVFFMINEDWSFAKAFYWCFITSMTVGYGDLTLKYESSRLFSIFYILLSVIVVAAAIGNFGAVQAEIAAEKKKIELLNRKLDLQMILEMDQDGDGVDKVEFLTAMLVANNGLDKAKDIDPWIKRFTELDKDGSGMLDKEDLRLFAEEERAKTMEALQRHSSSDNPTVKQQSSKNKGLKESLLDSQI